MTPKKRGPTPGTGGRPKNAIKTVKLTVRITEAADAQLRREADRAGKEPGKVLSGILEARRAPQSGTQST
jgi:hypothetical protein